MKVTSCAVLDFSGPVSCSLYCGRLRLLFAHFYFLGRTLVHSRLRLWKQGPGLQGSNFVNLKGKKKSLISGGEICVSNFCKWLLILGASISKYVP